MTSLTYLQRLRRFASGPVMRVVIGTVALSLGLVLAADTTFKLLRNDAEFAREVRKRVSENVAIQIAVLESKGDISGISKTVEGIMRHEPSILSVGVREINGNLAFQTPDHARYWPHNDVEVSTPAFVKVPLWEDEKQWGHVEIAYQPVYAKGWIGWVLHPHVLLIASVSILGVVVFSLYLRRVLKQLDPSQAIPERVKIAMDLLSDGVLILDQYGRIMLANRQAEQMLGVTPASVFGRQSSSQRWAIDALGDDPDHYPWNLAMKHAQPQPQRLIEIQSDGDSTRQLLVSAAPVIDIKGKVRGCFVNFTDVSALHRMNNSLQVALNELERSHEKIELQNVQLLHAAQIDALTGCLNRRALFEIGEKFFDNAKTEHAALACIMVDIDKFKSVNDTYGHLVGDQVIVQFSRILLKLMRPGDIVGRFGGEEFCVLMPRASSQHAAIIAERLRAAVAAECGQVLRDVQDFVVTASFGVSEMGHGARDLQELLEMADAALYEAKNAGRNQVCATSHTNVRSTHSTRTQNLTTITN